MSRAERIAIDLARQELVLEQPGQAARRYPVSTARNGAGERVDSECTPRGTHTISAKIGDGCPPNTVFVGRRPTGEIFEPGLAAAHPGRDWILTRILWLAGAEPGRNAGGDCDTLSRYIYIHGTPDSTPLGRPGSRGCIRMRNADILELYERVAVGTEVVIVG
jgi:L,D-transpeptidase YbiS